MSPGCNNCYAFTLHDQRYLANRDAAVAGLDAEYFGPLGKVPEVGRARGVVLPFGPQYDRPFSTVQMLDDRRLTMPQRTQKPHAYFVDSMADLFHEDVPFEFVDKVWAVMSLAPQHIFMILTKRPARMREYAIRSGYDPLPNVWLGTSVEDQERADERVPVLLDIPAAVRFLSCEPLLGPVEFDEAWLYPSAPIGLDGGGDYVRGEWRAPLSWVIVGGESGPHHRTMDVGWVDGLVAQCSDAGVPVFVKQLGSSPYRSAHDGSPDTMLPLRHSHGGLPDEWPADLRVRQFPVEAP